MKQLEIINRLVSELSGPHPPLEEIIAFARNYSATSRDCFTLLREMTWGDRVVAAMGCLLRENMLLREEIEKAMRQAPAPIVIVAGEDS